MNLFHQTRQGMDQVVQLGGAFLHAQHFITATNEFAIARRENEAQFGAFGFRILQRALMQQSHFVNCHHAAAAAAAACHVVVVVGQIVHAARR